jgi:hypothetical protein
MHQGERLCYPFHRQAFVAAHFIITTIYFLSLWPRGVVFAMSACPGFPPEYSQSILTPSVPQTSSVLLRQTPRRLRPHSQLIQLYPAPLRSCQRPLNRRQDSSPT